jgi:hypothetical protein
MTPGVSRSAADLREILELASLHSPGKVKEAGFFLVTDEVESNGLKYANRFLAITPEILHKSGVTRSEMPDIFAHVMRSRGSATIMTCCQSWEGAFFNEPFLAISEPDNNANRQREIPKKQIQWPLFLIGVFMGAVLVLCLMK